jgi:hypothetical protein
MAAFQIVTPTKFGQVAIGITNTTIYTVPLLTAAYLKDIDIPNTTAAAISVTVYIGNSTTQANILIPNVTIPANSIFQWTGTQILNAGDVIVAIASAFGCNAIVSGATAV